MNMEQLARADWEQLEHDVVSRIHLLRDTVRICHGCLLPEKADEITNDLVLPCIDLLAAFCVKVSEYEP